MSSIDTVATPIDFTEEAALKIKSLIEEEGNPNLMLRMGIVGGGCSGLKYDFTLDEIQNPNDFLIEKIIQTDPATSAIKIVVDAISLQYLTGAKVDYKEELSGAQFIIHNPQATTQCGCGSSFSVEES